MQRDVENQTPERDESTYTTLVYEQELLSPADKIAAAISAAVAKNAELDIRVDVRKNDDGADVLSTYTATSQRDSKATAALFQGLHSIVTRELSNNAHTSAGTASITHAVSTKAEAAVRQITDNPDLSEDFSRYYSGLRWSTDNKTFVSSLFEHSAQLDVDFVMKNSNGYDIIHLLDQLSPTDFGDYAERLRWSESTPKKIVKAFPAIDPAQLDDPLFAASPDGKALKSSYARLKGQHIAHQYTQNKSYPGFEKPIIPLQSFPLIEALVVDTVSVQKPSAKYDFGPHDVNELVLESDSIDAQTALVDSLMYRLPKEERHVFDGPNELQQKHRTIHDIIRASEKEKNLDRKEVFQTQLLQILNAYQGDGTMAVQVRQDNSEYSSEPQQMKGIVKSIMTVGLTSNKPESFIRAYQAAQESTSLATPDSEDPLRLTQADLIEVTLDAISKSSKDSSAFAIESFAARAFNDDTLAGELRRIVELRIEASQLFDQPAVHLARNALRRHISTEDKDRTAFDEATVPANERSRAASTLLNTFIINYLQDMVEDSDPATASFDMATADKLIKHISFGETMNAAGLPAIYSSINEVITDEKTPMALKSALLFSLAEATKYSGAHASYLDVVLDGYKAILGSPENLSRIEYSSSMALYALNTIATDHAIFRYARVEQIEELDRYKTALIQLAGRIENGQLTNSASVDGSDADNSSDIYNIENVARELSSLEEQYAQYLHMEAVRRDPHTYYNWVLRTMAPFWNDMRWEMGPGQQPKRDITELYKILEDHISNKLVILEDGASHDKDFDIITDGHIGSLLYECYQRMIPRSDIQYNNTVWQKGMPFVHDVTRNMPKDIAAQLMAAYPGSNFAKYIDGTKQK